MRELSSNPRSGRRPASLLAALFLPLLAVLTVLSACGDDDGSGGGGADEPASNLLDLSGLAWLEGNRFVGVHDAKNPDELDRPRVSILTLATGPEGTSFRTVDLDWPEPLGPSSDLESVAKIPGTSDLLLAESGDDGDPDFRRIFHVRWDGQNMGLIDYAFWPVDIFNVEAIAVAQVASGYIFAFAERAEGMPFTEIRWAAFDPQSLTFGAFSSATFDNPDPERANRPVVGMDVDSRGYVYVVSAFDPDVDEGPFESAVYLVGQFVAQAGTTDLILDDEPELVGRVDGFKTESVTLREIGGEVEIFIGTDDENLGNVLRPLP